jgi:hypothetical protein
LWESKGTKREGIGVTMLKGLNNPSNHEEGGESWPDNTVTVVVHSEKIRNLGQEIRKSKGGFTTVQAEAFLELYGDELETYLEKTVKDFVRGKIG